MEREREKESCCVSLSRTEDQYIAINYDRRWCRGEKTREAEAPKFRIASGEFEEADGRHPPLTSQLLSIIPAARAALPLQSSSLYHIKFVLRRCRHRRNVAPQAQRQRQASKNVTRRRTARSSTGVGAAGRYVAASAFCISRVVSVRIGKGGADGREAR
jgi:hypothetical protein